MDKLKQLLEQAEGLAVEAQQASDALAPALQSPHVVALRARISAALDSLAAHEAHVAANPPPAIDK